uniref:Melanocortin 2 receptor accessory protein n=1 Tax=Cyprinus carpio TaxID=7962 RepID=A0A8C1DMF4_CYPCA
MKNSTKPSEYVWDYEYYYDYIDPVSVNASTLKYNRYSIVIIFWIILAAFIGFFFLILNFSPLSVNKTNKQTTLYQWKKTKNAGYRDYRT